MKENLLNKKHCTISENNEMFYERMEVLEAMQEYSDLQNKELIERVNELESELTELKIKHNFLCKQYNKLCEND